MIYEQKEQNWLITVSLAIVAVVAAAAALIYTRAVMIPFVVALFIVALVSPIEDFQVKWLRLPRVIAIIVTLLVVMAVIALVFLLIAQAITTIVSTAGEYSASFEYMANKLIMTIEYMYPKEEPPPTAAPNDIGPLPPAAPNNLAPVPEKTGPLVLYPQVEEVDQTATLDVRSPVSLPTVDPNDPNAARVLEEGLPRKGPRIDTQRIVMDLKNYIFNIVTNAFGTILGLISSMLFVVIFVLFMLLGRNPYAVHSQVYSDVVHKIRKYVGIKIMVSAITGTLVWTILTILGLKLAGVFGILAFLLNFIPSIGSIVVTFLPIPIAVVQFQSSPLLIVLVVAIPGAVQNILGNIIEPKLQGEGLNLHPVTILLALSFWGLLWGIVGMFLAAPITAAIRIVLLQFEMLRPIAHLMAGELGPRNALDRLRDPQTSTRPGESRSDDPPRG